MLAVAVARSTPLTLGALAGISCERSGVVNIAIEGMMRSAAFFGFITGVYTHSLALGLAVALVSGGIMAALHAVLSISFKVDQIISGTVINILAVGVTGFFNRFLFQQGVPGGQSTLPEISIPLLGQIPLIGRILFVHQ